MYFNSHFVFHNTSTALKQTAHANSVSNVHQMVSEWPMAVPSDTVARRTFPVTNLSVICQ